MPPPELRFMGTSDKKFLESGRQIVSDVKEMIGLRKRARILDIGSGYGRVAYALWGEGHRGQYLGVDLLEEHIRWCQRWMTPASDGRYRFVFLDIYNDRYNKTGSMDASDVSLDMGMKPDLVLVMSVFTHMFPESMRHYLDEIGGVLARGGRVMATFFLINESQQALESQGRSRYPVEHELTPFARFWKPDDPLHVIAYDQEWVVGQIEEAGLEVEAVHLGAWCGRSGAPVYQDTLILGKGRQRGRRFDLFS